MPQQRGFGLIEVLVSMLIIAVGVIGLMSLQTYTLSQAKETEYYNRANFLAKDIFERMRANFDGVDASPSAYALTLNQTINTPTVDCGVATARCTGAQMAAWDLFYWCDRLRKELDIVIDDNATPACSEAPAQIVITSNTSTANSVTFERYSAVVSVVVPVERFGVGGLGDRSRSTLTFQFASEI